MPRFGNAEAGEGIDITVGMGQTQAQVMDWQSSSPVALPMIPLQ